MKLNRSIGCAAFALLSQVQTLPAEIVHFTNPASGEPGHYDWHVTIIFGQVTQSWLDITLSPRNQTDRMNGNSVGQIGRIDPPHFHQFNETYGGASVAGSMTQWGELTSSLEWGQDLGQFQFLNYSKHAFRYFTSIISDFPEGQHRYIGVRTQSGHYGWIDVVRKDLNLTAYAWAYEIETGVPIYAGQIPAPITLVIMAFAPLFSLSRRRRET